MSKPTLDHIRRQYAKNAAGLWKLHTKAVRLGKKVNGYTAEQLAQSVADYTRYSQLEDAPLAEHLRSSFQKAAKRVRDSRGGRPTAALINGKIVFTYPDGVNTPSVDLIVGGGGTVYTLTPRTEVAERWLAEHCETESYQWLGNALVVGHRYVADIVEGAQADGLIVR